MSARDTHSDIFRDIKKITPYWAHVTPLSRGAASGSHRFSPPSITERPASHYFFTWKKYGKSLPLLDVRPGGIFMLKLVINADEAVRHIRNGLSDEELMKEYEISARALESLFARLLQAGLLTSEEMDRRRLRSQRSHIVSLSDIPVPEPRTAVIDPNDAVASIRADLSDERLMQEFNLSARGLASLFRKLTEQGYISDIEFERIRSTYDKAEISVESDPPLDDLPEPTEAHPLFDTLYPKPSAPTRRVSGSHLAAVGGFIAGVAAVLSVLFLTGAVPNAWMKLFSRAETRPVSAVEDTGVDIDHFVAVLKAIEKEARERDENESFETASGYRKCLEACGSLLYSHDDEDRALVVNCRQRCIAQYDEHFKRIRRRFESDPFVFQGVR
jgi:AraC-like DNA-binding protein